MGILKEMTAGGYEKILFFQDSETDLSGLIVIHNSTLGPAFGGCRMIAYLSEEAAILDAMRLSKAMTYKNSLAGLNHGGGKAVIIVPERIRDRKRLFQAFGAVVDSLGGRYITAVDSGTSTKDMDEVKKSTRYVAGFSIEKGGSGDPSPMTALGVLRGIEACVQFKLNRKDLEGLTVALQGLGHVGYPLAEHLYKSRAKLVVCDLDPDRVEKAMVAFNAAIVPPDRIYDIECDIFSPNALGAILNDQTIPRLRCSIVAGAANNQLAEDRHGEMLAKRGILYAPDYAINAGGIINVAQEWEGYDEEKARRNTENIYNTMMEIFTRARREGKRPEEIADRLSEERIFKARSGQL